MNSNFQTFADFWGFGDPHRDIWFVGIEESGCEVNSNNLHDFISERKKLRIFKNKVDCRDNSVWQIIYTLLLELKNEDFSKDYKEKYKELLFAEDHSYFFLTHLFPLPRLDKRIWPEIYEKLFGYREYELLRYLSDVRSYRYPKLFELWDTYKPNITVCFGKQHWNEFTNAFKLGQKSFEPYAFENIFYYPDEGIILTPHFSNAQISGFVKKELLKLMKES